MHSIVLLLTFIFTVLDSKVTFPLKKKVRIKMSLKKLWVALQTHVRTFGPTKISIDGGEYVGERDWESIPKQNLKHVFLDDICSDKNKGLHQRLKEDSEWDCMIERKEDRNGWAYWKKRNY